MLRIRRDPARREYVDRALQASPEETEALELFTHSDDARAAVQRVRTLARLTGSADAPVPANP
jgi:hypothetical protein